MTTTIPDPQIYRAAIGVITRNGWTQRKYVQPVGGRPIEQCPVDVVGAIRLALGVDPDAKVRAAELAIRWAERHLDENPPGEICLTLQGWNDAPVRLVEGVLTFLEHVASAAESALAAQDGGEGRG